MRASTLKERLRLPVRALSAGWRADGASLGAASLQQPAMTGSLRLGWGMRQRAKERGKCRKTEGTGVLRRGTWFRSKGIGFEFRQKS